jgi:D-beta-D-heptose 7-phosphate kinase/D-beta-D-heptose 1-phosphate adenosyltransferase
MVRVCTSGYFDPLHVGHIECFEQAKALGDWLVVIINNDYQAYLKKGKSFMSEQDRFKIISSLKCVDEVIISIDKDKSCCESLRLVNPDIFAKGGDRFANEVPEKIVCDELNIKIVDNLGEKIRSSSELIDNYEKI